MDHIIAVRLIYTVLLSVTALIAVMMMIYAYKRRTIRGANYLILLLFAVVFYNVTYIGEINSDSFSSAIIWFRIEHIAIPLQQYFWVLICLEFVGVQKKYVRIAKYVMLYHPILYYSIFFTNSMHHLYISSYHFISNGYFPVIITGKGLLYWVIDVSGTLIVIFTTAMYLRALMKTSRLSRYGYIIMVIGSLFPLFSEYIYAFNKNYLGIDYYPVVMIFSALLYVFGIFRFGIFSTIPIFTETVFRKSKDGILIVDLLDRIIDVNDAFVNIYPELKKLSPQSTLASFVAAHPEFNGIMDGIEKLRSQLTINGEIRYYEFEIADIFAEDDFLIGKILTISDVTSFEENQKILELIAANAIDQAETNELSFLEAQIKPHFFNNTLSVIASMITRDPDAAKNLIAELGEYLADHYYFDSTSPKVLLDKEIETVNTYVAIEKARFRDRIHFHLDYDNVPEIYIPRLTLEPLVENAIRHGILKKSEGGNVWLEIRYNNERFDFTIKDDGAGMTEEKIAEVLNDENKNQGIGISNINKRLIKYYGEGLKINSSIGQGTSVMFSVPNNISSKEL